MKQIEFTIETLAPVAFAEKNNDSTLYTTKKYITGTALRGYLANRFINCKNLGRDAHKDSDFYDIFLSGKVKFLPAYPIGEDPANAEYEPFILPLSLMKHKSTNDIIDLSKENTKIAVGYKKFTGFAMRTGSTIYKADPKTQIQLHIARSKDSARITGSSKDGDIFNYEYIEPHQYFKGCFIASDDSAAEKLSKFLRKKVHTIHLGRSKQVQYGKCALKILEAAEQPAGKINTEKDFYLYAYTPYIPLTQWQRTDKIAADLLQALAEKLQTAYPDVKITTDNLKIFAANEEVGGYVNVWHTRQERKIALSPGSLIQFKAANMTDDAVSYLNDLLHGGMGWRTVEGFGQFRLWQAAEAVELKTLATPELKPPANLKSVADKVKAILQQRILIEIQKEAKHTADNAKPAENKKHILNRIEELMDSTSSKSDIQAKIREFKKKAKDNLHNIYIEKDDLCDILLEENGADQPYESIRWENKLGLKDNQAENLKNDFGTDVFKPDEDKLYRYFWLWFARHAKKNLADKDE